MDPIREGKVDYRNPYLNLADVESVTSQLQKHLQILILVMI